MRKRVMLATALAMGLCLSPISYAAESNGIDLDSMDLNALIELRDLANEKIAEKGGDNTIGYGVYEAGVDIKATSFKVTPIPNGSDTYLNFYIFANREAYESLDDSGSLSLDSNEEDGFQVGNLNLKEGQIVWLTNGAAILEESKPSWAPDSSEVE